MSVTIRISRKRRIPATDAALRRLLKQAAKAALARRGLENPVEVDLTLTDNDGIRELNREYREKDAATDVLSFPMYEAAELDTVPAAMPLLLGDIVISREKAAAQAEAYGHSELRETVFLFTHGMLHLLGWDHELGEAEEKEMFAIQDEILDALGVTR